MSIFILFGQLAFAQSAEQVSFWPTEELQEIYSLWYEGSFVEAQKRIKEVRAELDSSKNNVVRKDMFYIQFLRGMIHFASQDEKDAIASWRQAILWNPNIDFPDYLYAGSQMESQKNYNWDIFSGLRGEFGVRSTIPFPFPEEGANVGLYVNGFPYDDFQGVYEGTHLIQVDCPQDPIQSFWVRVKSKKGMKSFPYQGKEWYQICASGFELQEEEDEFANFAIFTNPTPNSDKSKSTDIGTVDSESSIIPSDNDKLKDDKDDAVTSYAPEEPKLSAKTEEIAEIPKESAPEINSEDISGYPVESKNSDSVKVVRIDNTVDLVPMQIGLLSVSGGCLVLGTLWTATAVRRDYAMIKDARDNPEDITRLDADSFTEQFQKTQRQARMFFISSIIFGVSGASLSLVHTDQQFGFQYHRTF